MIRELNVYRCICAKCKHSWVTKTHDLPDTCAKCKTKKWNVDYSPVLIPETVEPEKLVYVEAASKFDGVPMNDATAAFLTKTVIEMPEADPVADEWRFTNEKPQHDSTTDSWYRQQYLVNSPKRKRTVEVDAGNYDEIVQVM